MTLVDSGGNIFYAVLISVLTNATFVALLIFVFKAAFEKILEKKMELHKKELELLNQKKFYRFGKTYDEQASIIRTLYSELVGMMGTLQFLATHYEIMEENPDLRGPRISMRGSLLKKLDFEERQEGKARELGDRAAKVLTDFHRNRIYFDRVLADEIDRILSMIMFVGSEFKNVTFKDDETLEFLADPKLIELWKNCVKLSNGVFPRLENEFRKHLGIDAHAK